MAAVAAQAGCPIILMHNRHNRDYQDLISDMTEDLTVSINLALTAGVEPQNIILDPGIGFAKDYTENLQAMMGLDVLGELGYPLLLATSRKNSSVPHSICRRMMLWKGPLLQSLSELPRAARSCGCMMSL